MKHAISTTPDLPNYALRAPARSRRSLGEGGKVGLYRLCATALLIALGTSAAHAEDGYELWLRYHRVADGGILKQYRSAITGLLVSGESPTARAVSANVSSPMADLQANRSAIANHQPASAPGATARSRRSLGEGGSQITNGTAVLHCALFPVGASLNPDGERACDDCCRDDLRFGRASLRRHAARSSCAHSVSVFQDFPTVVQLASVRRAVHLSRQRTG